MRCRARIASLLAATLVAGLAAPAVGHAALPTRMAALGDSFTVAAYSCAPATACPANSWSTGTNAAVDSHYRRLLALEPAINGRASNFAVSGRKVSALDAQAASAVAQNAQYVTILIGLNDLCRETETAMTPVTTYRAQFQTAFNRLKSGLPNAKVLVASVPDPYLLWQNHKDTAAARSAWSSQDICRVMLADPLGTSTADVAQRDRVRARGAAFTSAMQQICATWANCRHDGGAMASWPWTVMTSDWFHPSVAGQAQISGLLWDAGFDFEDDGSEEPPPPPPPPGPWTDTVLADGPISFWRLGEASGTTAADVRGANPGTYLAGTTLGVPGAIGSNTAISVPTTINRGVRVPDRASLDVGDTFTVEAWVRRSAINRTSGLFNRGTGSFQVFFDGGNRLTLRRVGTGTIVTATKALTDTTGFHHVAVTKAGASVKLYLDGQDVTGTVRNYTLAVNANPFEIGTEGFGGTIDEVAIYGKALTASRVAAHHAAR